jgi:hypothetical protein
MRIIDAEPVGYGYRYYVGDGAVYCAECYADGDAPDADAAFVAEVESWDTCDACGGVIIGPAVTGPFPFALAVATGEDALLTDLELTPRPWHYAATGDGVMVTTEAGETWHADTHSLSDGYGLPTTPPAHGTLWFSPAYDIVAIAPPQGRADSVWVGAIR